MQCLPATPQKELSSYQYYTPDTASHLLLTYLEHWNICVCVTIYNPRRHEDFKLYTARPNSLWFCSLLPCPYPPCNWSKYNIMNNHSSYISHMVFGLWQNNHIIKRYIETLGHSFTRSLSQTMILCNQQD